MVKCNKNNVIVNFLKHIRFYNDVNPLLQTFPTMPWDTLVEIKVSNKYRNNKVDKTTLPIMYVYDYEKDEIVDFYYVL